jgi:hypothetical protein
VLLSSDRGVQRDNGRARRGVPQTRGQPSSLPFSRRPRRCGTSVRVSRLTRRLTCLRAMTRPTRTTLPARTTGSRPPREFHRGTLALAGARLLPVLQRRRRVRQAGVVGLLGVLRPPRRHLVLDRIPVPPQRGQGPTLPRRHLVPGQAVGLLGPPLLPIGPDPADRPVIGGPGSARMGGQRGTLGWGGVQGERVHLHHEPGARLELLHRSPPARMNQVDRSAGSTPAQRSPARSISSSNET